MHDDMFAAGLLGLALTAIETLTPLVGAIVAALAIRRRGRNARRAFAGCLVMLFGPIVSLLASAFGLEALMRAFGPVVGAYLPGAMAMPFHLVGFGLLLAGALSEPKPQPVESLPLADAAATV